MTEKVQYIPPESDSEDIVDVSVTVEDGQSFSVPNGTIIQTCCDCGMTHLIKINAKNVEASFTRMDHVTEEMRKREKFPVFIDA